MKKLLSLLLCAVMVLSLVACGGNEPTPTDAAKEPTATDAVVNEPATTEKTKIRLAYWNSEDTVADLLAYLETAVPDVEIEYQFIDNSNYATIIDTQLSAGEGPDIICESPATALKHAKLGYLADVSLIYAMLSFLAVVVLTKVYMGVYLARKADERRTQQEKEHSEEKEDMNHV